MRWLVGGTLLTAIVEWLMLELLRTPYRPPADMLTLLGTEKYGLAAIMIGLGIAWAIFVVLILTRTRMTITNYLVFTLVIATIMVLFCYITANPHRAVTPWHLVWA